MTDKQVSLRQRLQRLGFTKGIQMKLYGEVFDVVGEPVILTDDFVFVDAQEGKTGKMCRVRIPPLIVQVASGEG
jgi:hypothetical protein